MDNKIIYENKPYGATQNSLNTTNDMKSFVNMDEIKQGLNISKYATLENDYWKLDGTFSLFPDEPKNIGYMSESLSNENGVFDKEITITRTYDNTYTSPRNNDNF